MGECYYIGFDIGGTKCAVLLGDSSGKIYDRLAFHTETERGPQYIIDKLINKTCEIVDKNNTSIKKIKSLGISCG